jgi:phosphopantothenoylcysteine decarboxylase/phosphopantothenate--cysteine ligase
MSPMAQKILHPYLLEWATGNPVVTELTGQIEHISLAGKHAGHVDLVLVAPATANTIGKVANGIDDTPVTTTVSSAIGAHIPVLLVPAMHETMYYHPAVIANIEKLHQMGVGVVAPRLEEDKAKIPEVDEIVEHVLAVFGPDDLHGKRFVVTAGPTRGWIDRVRYMTNPSTGKMGIEVAREIIGRGGSVTLVIGPTTQPLPRDAEIKHVETAEEMMQAVLDALAAYKASAFVSAAAVLDFAPAKRENRKRPSGEPYAIELVSTPKIIEEVRKRHKDLFIVGFKVESGVTDEELDARARTKVNAGVCNLVIGNDEQRKGAAFGADTNEVVIVGPKGFAKKVPLATKREVARAIVDEIAERI